jgi:hypothetical protein
MSHKVQKGIWFAICHITNSDQLLNTNHIQPPSTPIQTITVPSTTKLIVTYHANINRSQYQSYNTPRFYP